MDIMLLMAAFLSSYQLSNEPPIFNFDINGLSLSLYRKYTKLVDTP